MSKTRLMGVCDKNVNGGYYHRGDSYPFAKKTEIVETFFNLWEDKFPTRPSYSSIAKLTKVSHPTVKKFIEEFEEQGFITDPMEDKVMRKVVGEKKTVAQKIPEPAEELFLLLLHVENPMRPNASYINSLSSILVQKSL